MDQAMKMILGFLVIMMIMVILGVTAAIGGVAAILGGGMGGDSGQNPGSGGGGGAYASCIPDPNIIGGSIPQPGPSGVTNGGCPPGSVPAPLPSGGQLVGFTPEVAAAIEAAAAQYGINPCLLGAIAMQESGGNPNAISADGGYGLFQITNGGPFSLDPKTNSNAGAAHISGDLSKAQGDTYTALIYYNCGSGCGHPPNAKYTTHTQWPDGSLSYPDSVMRRMKQVCPNMTSGMFKLGRKLAFKEHTGVTT